MEIRVEEIGFVVQLWWEIEPRFSGVLRFWKLDQNWGVLEVEEVVSRVGQRVGKEKMGVEIEEQRESLVETSEGDRWGDFVGGLKNPRLHAQRKDCAKVLKDLKVGPKMDIPMRSAEWAGKLNGLEIGRLFEAHGRERDEEQPMSYLGYTGNCIGNGSSDVGDPNEKEKRARKFDGPSRGIALVEVGLVGIESNQVPELMGVQIKQAWTFPKEEWNGLMDQNFAPAKKKGPMAF